MCRTFLMQNVTPYFKNLLINLMCVAANGKNACQDDSGGPLYDKNSNVLVGLVSWGYGCADPD